MSTVSFYFFAAVILISALRTVTCTKPVHALLAMVVCLLAISGLFFVIGAPFAGAVEVIVYAGAIMVLFVFVLVMLNLGRDTDITESALFSVKAWALPSIAASLIFVMMLLIIMKADGHANYLFSNPVDAKAVGVSLYGAYFVLVEAAALILLAALVAAYHIAKKDSTKKPIKGK